MPSDVGISTFTSMINTSFHQYILNGVISKYMICYFYCINTTWAPRTLRVRQSRAVVLRNVIQVYFVEAPWLSGYCVLNYLENVSFIL